MKKILPFLILLILPVFFYLSLQKYKDALGEYYLDRNYDPSYPYLINSLNLAQFNGFGVGLIAHPGTTVQEIGAVVLLIYHSFQAENNDLVRDVFNDPEFYLNKIFKTFLLMNTAAIFLLGYLIFKRTKSLATAVFLQLSPFSFYSDDIFFQMTNVSVEPMLVFIILLLITAIFIFLNNNGADRKSLNYSIVFGVLCGLGMVTKISFLPVMMIPFLLIKEIKFRVIFILISILTFLIFVFPAFSAENADGFSVWIKDLVTHSGKYGKGSEDFVQTSVYLSNIKTIFSQNLFFSLSYISLISILIFQFFKKHKSQIRSNKYFSLIAGIFIAMSLLILMVAKHFSLYYMIPAYMFSLLALFAVSSLIISLYPEFLKHKNKSYFYYAVIGIVLVFSIFQVRKIYKETKYAVGARNDARVIIKSLEENYGNSIVVGSYQCSGKEFALHLGSSFGGTQRANYMSILKEMHPNNFYYNRWDNTFYQDWDIEYIREQLIKANKFIFQGKNDEVAKDFINLVKKLTGKPNASYKKIISGYNRDCLYEITLE
ncbi:MAG: hypothetical protein ABI840_11075 [bacterium]